jgi:hypothetical protein
MKKVTLDGKPVLDAELERATRLAAGSARGPAAPSTRARTRFWHPGGTET